MGDRQKIFVRVAAKANRNTRVRDHINSGGQSTRITGSDDDSGEGVTLSSKLIQESHSAVVHGIQHKVVATTNLVPVFDSSHLP